MGKMDPVRLNEPSRRYEGGFIKVPMSDKQLANLRTPVKRLFEGLLVLQLGGADLEQTSCCEFRFEQLAQLLEHEQIFTPIAVHEKAQVRLTSSKEITRGKCSSLRSLHFRGKGWLLSTGSARLFQISTSSCCDRSANLNDSSI